MKIIFLIPLLALAISCGRECEKVTTGEVGVENLETDFNNPDNPIPEDNTCLTN
jgi:hypothetical protein